MNSADPVGSWRSELFELLALAVLGIGLGQELHILCTDLSGAARAVGTSAVLLQGLVPAVRSW